MNEQDLKKLLELLSELRRKHYSNLTTKERLAIFTVFNAIDHQSKRSMVIDAIVGR